MVELEGVGFRTGGFEIVRDVSLSFPRGRLSVVLGPNGAGKSTLLRLAAGLLGPSAGSICYGDRPLDAFGPLELARTRAFLSQHVEMPFPLAAEDVVMLGRYPHYARVPTAVDRRVVEQAMNLVEVLDKRCQAYPTLSGGEQQKVQLARVLAQIWNDGDAAGPRVLFLDEPTASLDVHYQIHLLELATQLVAEGVTVVATLHDLNVALQYGDSFVLMESGKVLLQCDNAREITGELLERVFRVQARRVDDSYSNGSLWRFGRSVP